jgi:hypothetical protein
MWVITLITNLPYIDNCNKVIRRFTHLRKHRQFMIIDDGSAFVCLFGFMIVYSPTTNFSAIWRLSSLPASNLYIHSCLALLNFNCGGSFTYHTYYDTGLPLIRSCPKDRYPCLTVGFEPVTQGSSGLYAATLTTPPRRWLIIKGVSKQHQHGKTDGIGISKGMFHFDVFQKKVFKYIHIFTCIR